MLHESSNSKLLAVFWYTGQEFIGPEDTRDGDSVTDYGGMIQLDVDHFSVWDRYNPYGFGVEYDYLPRGRVMFDVKIHKFVVVADEKIVGSEHLREELRRWYGLPQTTIFESDEHYQSELEV